MIDMHYDLLSIIYRDILKGNLDEVKNWINYYNKNNVTGLIANLYFMSEQEMIDELHPKYYQAEISVLEMFQKSIKKLKELMPQDIKVLYAIEGCDYIKDEKELEELRKSGLSSICLVWNEKNKYGSGTRFEGGLTELGKSFLHKAIELGIGIDLSHTNEETFYDIINLVKEEKENGLSPVVYASHSNSRTLCERVRNLKDEQLESIKEVDGYVGIMSNRNFVNVDNENMTNEEIIKGYLEHIDYIGTIIGFDHIMLSTDDMTFEKEINPIYATRAIYNYENIRSSIEKELLEKYSEDVVKDILEGNAKKIFEKIEYKNYVL